MRAARPAIPARLAPTVAIGIAAPLAVAEDTAEEAAEPAALVALATCEEAELATEDADA